MGCDPHGCECWISSVRARVGPRSPVFTPLWMIPEWPWLSRTDGVAHPCLSATPGSGMRATTFLIVARVDLAVSLWPTLENAWPVIASDTSLSPMSRPRVRNKVPPCVVRVLSVLSPHLDAECVNPAGNLLGHDLGLRPLRIQLATPRVVEQGSSSPCCARSLESPLRAHAVEGDPALRSLRLQ